MRVPTQIPPTIFETFPRSTRLLNRTTSPAFLQSRQLAMSNTASPTQQPLSAANYKIETTDVNTATGVSLSEPQQVITGSILDLFAGRPSLRKLSLWQDNAAFVDPLTIAEGRKQYSAQWYGLKAAFSDIQRLHSQVTSAGNPIEMELRTKYKVKGIGSEQTVESKIKIWTEGEGDAMRVKRVEDRWNDELPDGAFKNALRNLNSVTVPLAVSVPKSIEEEESVSA